MSAEFAHAAQVGGADPNPLDAEVSAAASQRNLLTRVPSSTPNYSDIPVWDVNCRPVTDPGQFRPYLGTVWGVGNGAERRDKPADEEGGDVVTNGTPERQIMVNGCNYQLRLIHDDDGQADRVAAWCNGHEVHTVHLTRFLSVMLRSDVERAAVIPAAFSQLEADLRAGRP
ncbi:MAG: hypothetical protein ABWY00_16060 [Dongiaceae bacterium]